MELFESYDRRIDKILGVLKEYGIGSVEECRDICAAAGLDPYKIVKDVQPIAFENAGWAYTVGAAIAIKTNAVAENLVNNADPQNSYGSKFSIQYCTAAAICFGAVGVDEFGPEKLNDPALRRLMANTAVFTLRG